MDHFLGVALLKRVSGSILMGNAKKLDKSLQVTSMPGFLSVGIIKEKKDKRGGGGMKK